MLHTVCLGAFPSGMSLLFYFIFLTQIPYLCCSHKDPTLALLDTGTSFLSFMLVFLSVMTVILPSAGLWSHGQ